MLDKNLTLYHYWRSSCSWRLRWAFHLKNVSYTKKAINLLEGDQKKENYLKLNPSGQVPCIEIENYFVSESFALLEWLEETYPSPELLPQNSISRLKIREFCYKIVCGIQPIQNLAVMKAHSQDVNEQKRWSRMWIERGLKSCERILESTATRFCFGSELTLADLCLVPQVYNAKRFDVDLGSFPHVHKVYENCLVTDSCQASHPDKSKDSFLS